MGFTNSLTLRQRATFLGNGCYYSQRRLMPVIRNIPLKVSDQDVLRRAGNSSQRPVIEGIVRGLLRETSIGPLLEPAIAYDSYPIVGFGGDQTRLIGDICIEGSLIPSVFGNAKEIMVAVCTIGSRLEEEVKACFQGGEKTKGLLLDGMGTAAVDSLAQEACRIMSGIASERGYESSSALSPGMPGFPISEQHRLFAMLPARDIGVTLTASGMMVPRKSVSMVLGFGPAMRRWGQQEVCRRCILVNTCRYKYSQRRK